MILIPLPDGDSWIRRLTSGYASYQSSGNAMDLLQEDSAGNNTASIAILQMKQNALGAVGTIVGFGIGAAVLRKLRM